MPFRLTSRVSRAPSRVAPTLPHRTLRHHRARSQALAGRKLQHGRLEGIRAWFRAFFSMMNAHVLVRRTGLRSLLQKPSSLRALALRRAHGPQRRINRPRRQATSTGWFAFATR
ncbi:hypothetical protein [Burkholderia guangdongensis]|uniref:hypothetical protein n=1 Tax=Burkholderia guangdongensis TaxID=1792500 RepID=UPI0015CB5C80|nr:hypothetical protein [Burkholderia guangdongensis]